jgi:uncharacterized membrane protein SpoIIM required for sporulation
MIQEILTILIVSGAAFYIAYFVWKNGIRKKDKCDGCALKKMVQGK